MSPTATTNNLIEYQLNYTLLMSQLVYCLNVSVRNGRFVSSG